MQKKHLGTTLKCYFDAQIQEILSTFLPYISLSNDKFNSLLEFMKNSNCIINDTITKILIIHFNDKNLLLTLGKSFFTEKEKINYVQLITDIESNKYDLVCNYLKNDIELAIIMADILKNYPELRRNIIEIIPNDKNSLKEKTFNDTRV